MATATKAPVATAAAPAAEVPGVLSAEELLQQVTDTLYKRGEVVDTLQSQLKYHEDQIGSIKELLEKMGEKVEDSPDEPEIVIPTGTKKRGRPKGSTNGTSAPAASAKRGDYTVPEGVLEVLRRATKGLTRGEVASRMVTEIHYPFKDGATGEAIDASVYTGGINKGMQAGLIKTTGKKGKTLYHHHENYAKLVKSQE